MTEDSRCCGTGACIIDADGRCWCGQRWNGERMCRETPASASPADAGKATATPADDPAT